MALRAGRTEGPHPDGAEHEVKKLCDAAQVLIASQPVFLVKRKQLRYGSKTPLRILSVPAAPQAEPR